MYEIFFNHFCNDANFGVFNKNNNKFTKERLEQLFILGIISSLLNSHSCELFGSRKHNKKEFYISIYSKYFYKQNFQFKHETNCCER